MKTRTGSDIEGNWDDTLPEDEARQDGAVAEFPSEEKLPEENVIMEETGYADEPISPDGDESSDPNTDGLDDEPLEDELCEGDDDEFDDEESADADEAPSAEDSIMDPPAEIAEAQDSADSDDSDMPLFEQYLQPKSADNEKKSIDLSDSHDSLGTRLKKLRSARRLSLDDVYARTHIVQDYLTNLEDGNYAELTGKIYAKRHLQSLCALYGVDSCSAEELQELLLKEYEASGYGEHEIQLPNSKTDDAGKRHGILLRKLPEIIISFLLIVVVVLIVLAVVFPLVKKSNGKSAHPVDMAPLVVPKQHRPLLIPMPK